jgi:hypothetical protein
MGGRFQGAGHEVEGAGAGLKEITSEEFSIANGLLVWVVFPELHDRDCA